MGSGHDELREAARRERVERDVRLPRPTLDRSACAPCSSSGGSGEGGSNAEPTAAEELPQERVGLVVRGRRVQRRARRRRRRRPPDLPRATRVAGGSITVSEAERLGPSRRREERDRRRRTSARRGDRRARGGRRRAQRPPRSRRAPTGGFGGNPGRSTRTSSKRSASGRCAAQVPRPPTTLPWTRTIRSIPAIVASL